MDLLARRQVGGEGEPGSPFEEVPAFVHEELHHHGHAARTALSGQPAGEAGVAQAETQPAALPFGPGEVRAFDLQVSGEVSPGEAGGRRDVRVSERIVPGRRQLGIFAAGVDNGGGGGGGGGGSFWVGCETRRRRGVDRASFGRARGRLVPWPSRGWDQTEDRAGGWRGLRAPRRRGALWERSRWAGRRTGRSRGRWRVVRRPARGGGRRRSRPRWGSGG